MIYSPALIAFYAFVVTQYE